MKTAVFDRKWLFFVLFEENKILGLISHICIKLITFERLF